MKLAASEEQQWRWWQGSEWGLLVPIITEGLVIFQTNFCDNNSLNYMCKSKIYIKK